MLACFAHSQDSPWATRTPCINHETLCYQRLGLSLLVINHLLKPEDVQDVPRAMDLLARLTELQPLPLDDNPSRRQEAQVLTLDGTM